MLSSSESFGPSSDNTQHSHELVQERTNVVYTYFALNNTLKMREFVLAVVHEALDVGVLSPLAVELLAQSGALSDLICQRCNNRVCAEGS